jgi:hypothetical protein
MHWERMYIRLRKQWLLILKLHTVDTPMENIVIAANVTLIVIDIRNEKRKRSVTNLNIQNDIPNNLNPVDEDDVETRRKKELPASQQDSDSYVLEEWTIILRI